MLPEETTDFQQDWCKAKTSSVRSYDPYSATAACPFSLPYSAGISFLVYFNLSYYLIIYFIISLPQIYFHSSKLDFILMVLRAKNLLKRFPHPGAHLSTYTLLKKSNNNKKNSLYHLLSSWMLTRFVVVTTSQYIYANIISYIT